MNTFIGNTDGTLNAAVTYFKLALAWYLKQLVVFKDVKFEVSDHSNVMDNKEHGWRYGAFMLGTGFEERFDKVYMDLSFEHSTILSLQEMVGHKTSKPSDTDLTPSETMAVLSCTVDDLYHWVLQGKLSLTFTFPVGEGVNHLPVFTKDSVIELYKNLYKADLVECNRLHMESELNDIDSMAKRDEFSNIYGALAYRRMCLQDMLKGN